MRAVDGADWLNARVPPDASLATAWATFKAYVIVVVDEPEEFFGQPRWVDPECDYLLFEAGSRGIDIQRQFTHLDRDGDYVGMSGVILSVRYPSDGGYVALWGKAGPRPAPLTEPAFGDEWVGGAEAWCAGAEATPVLAQALRTVTHDWSFWQSDI
jgi:hypothetical protein